MPPATYERVSTDEREEHPLADANMTNDELTESNSVQMKEPAHPHIYYEDGPFDAPSSDSEDDTLLEKDGASRGITLDRVVDTEGGLSLGSKGKRPVALRYFILSLCSLLLLAIIIGIAAARNYSGSSYRKALGSKHITMDHVFNGTFAVQTQNLRWVPEAGDGVYAVQEGGAIKFVDLKTNTTSDLVLLEDVKDMDGKQLWFVSWKLSPDMKFMLVKADWKKQWRHSSFGNYYVHDIDAKSTRPLIPPASPPRTAYATWSPTGEAIAYVTQNDLYILPSAAPDAEAIRITTSGNASLFHGVPDWVYEEEVFASDYALWWSPDSTKLAFLRLDETRVDFYSVPIYNPSADANAVYPYPSELRMKYPKPGYANPLVSVHVFDLARYSERQRTGDVLGFPVEDATRSLEWAGRQRANESVVTEVAWVGDSLLLVKEVNRAADDGSVVLFDLSGTEGGSSVHGKVVRKLGKNGEQGDDGWIECTQYVTPLTGALLQTLGTTSAYLDIVNNSAGYEHIALFSPADSSTPIFVTDGKWEVTGGVRGVNEKTGLVYFTAANPSSIERNVFAAPLPTPSGTARTSQSNKEKDVTALTDTSVQAWHDADFSPFAGFYLLSYKGPHVPWQSVFRVDKDWAEYEYPITTNPKLNETIAQFQTPRIVRGTIQNEGYELNYMELRPPNFDDSGRTKYPVLFKVYGGPASQQVHTRFELERDWHAYLACELKYVVVVVDGRGTGFKGRALRNPVRGQLGRWETRDQVAAAKIWAAKEYADPKRIGIWGWSYGGFMAAKVVEADAGVHSLAMAVAPVTSWRLYDSIYTERYLSTPQRNPTGYTTASVANVSGFAHASFLLAHGSGDDNVHFANSAHLLDMLTQARVRGVRFRMFTDSDHAISTRGAYRELHEFLAAFLVEKWGRGGRRRGW